MTLQQLANELSPIRQEPILNDGASLKEIRSAEKSIGIELPGPLKQLYLEANGENYSYNPHYPYAQSLFIDFDFYNLETMVSAYKTELAEHHYILDKDIWLEDVKSHPKHSTAEMYFCEGWLPFGGLEGSCVNYVAMDTMPGIGGVQNQIITFGRDYPSHVIKIADSLEDFFEMLLEHLKHFKVVSEPKKYENCFIHNILKSHNL